MSEEKSALPEPAPPPMARDPLWPNPEGMRRSNPIVEDVLAPPRATMALLMPSERRNQAMSATTTKRFSVVTIRLPEGVFPPKGAPMPFTLKNTPPAEEKSPAPAEETKS